MAAKTPSSLSTENFGSVKVIKAPFADLDDGDTWASGITGIWGYSIVDTDNPSTQASVGIAVAESSGTFTFYPAEDNKTATLFVYAKT